jgi:hypothetical protein
MKFFKKHRVLMRSWFELILYIYNNPPSKISEKAKDFDKGSRFYDAIVKEHDKNMEYVKEIQSLVLPIVSLLISFLTLVILLFSLFFDLLCYN